MAICSKAFGAGSAPASSDGEHEVGMTDGFGREGREISVRQENDAIVSCFERVESLRSLGAVRFGACRQQRRQR